LTTPEETPLAITLANLIVSDPDNTFPDDFTFSIQDGANYTRVGNTITPDTDFNGTLLVPATVNDGWVDSPVFNITVVVSSVNDLPMAADDTAALAEGATLNVAAPGLLANDSDPDTGDILTVNTTPVSAPSNGALTLYTDGAYDYVHDGTETTSDAFVYEISDGNGGTDQATVAITITPINDAPVITSTAPTTATEEVLYTYPVIVNDPDDPNNGIDLFFTLSNAPAGMTVSPTGLIEWTPLEGVTTSGLVTVFVADGGEDGALPGTEGFTITVTAVNDPPVAADDTATVDEGATLNVAAPGILANDSDPDIPAQTLTVNTTPVSAPVNGSLTLYSDGSYQYIHDSGETTSDAFVYEISDGNGGTDQATVNITITPVNDLPVAVDDTAIVAEGGTLNVGAPGVLANDSDPDPGDILTVNTTPVSGPTYGTLTLFAGGSYQYIHDGSQTTSDAFVYEISDGNGGTAQATVNITVTLVNEPPVAVGDTATVAEGGTLNVAAPGLLANDSDPDPGDILTVNTTPVSTPTNGSLTLFSDGSYQYIHDGSETASDSFVYEISDGNGATDQALVNISITAVNDPPVAVDDTATVSEGGILNVAAPGLLGVAPQTAP
jgi:VCBS repeat-containing protein